MRGHILSLPPPTPSSVIYTLFVDESGDFQSVDSVDARPRPWIVSGVLVPGKPIEAEALVERQIKPALEAEGIRSPGEAHLWEIRRDSPERARHMTRQVFRALADSPETIRIGAVRNRAHAVVGSAKAETGTQEKSYRLMVLDLLALLEAAIPTDEAVKTLYLVVAQRWRKGDSERMTSYGELLSDVIFQIQDAVEAGLASRGLLASTTNKSLRVEKAKERWGLAAADFVANTVYNEQSDRDVIQEFEPPPLSWRTFNAFGTYEQRRARVAERDGDIPTAIVRWALLKPSRDRADSLKRLWSSVMADRDPYGPRAALESILERLRKETPSDPTRLSAALSGLAPALETDTSPRSAAIIFRFRTFARATAHRHGDIKRAAAYAQQQVATRATMLEAPETLALVFDSDLYDVTALQYQLDLDGALKVAKDYNGLVERYGVVWGLFDEAGGADAFNRSRLALRARSLLAHAQLLAGGLGDMSLLDESAAVLERLNPTDPADVTRNRNNRITALAKLGRHDEALLLTHEALAADRPDEFDQFNALRAAASAALAHGPLYPGVREVYDLATASLLDGPDNPYHLTWREIALLRHLLGSSRRDVDQAYANAHTKTHHLADSPIKHWLLGVLTVHQNTFDGKPTSLDTVFGRTSPKADALVAAVRRCAQTDSTLAAVRHVSPY